VALVDTGALGQSAIRESELSASRQLITPGPAVAINNGESYSPSGEIELLVTYANKTALLQSQVPARSSTNRSTYFASGMCPACGEDAFKQVMGGCYDRQAAPPCVLQRT
jgi:hypothetical protein